MAVLTDRTKIQIGLHATRPRIVLTLRHPQCESRSDELVYPYIRQGGRIAIVHVRVLKESVGTRSDLQTKPIGAAATQSRKYCKMILPVGYAMRVSNYKPKGLT